MSVIRVCDKCKTQKAGILGGNGKDEPQPFDWVVITPGYVGTKLLCRPCYDAFIRVVREFFGVDA